MGRYFLSLPLESARAIAARVASTVANEAGRIRLLDDAGDHVMLREALRAEIPRLSDDLLGLATEVASTAHQLAAAEWRQARPPRSDTPVIVSADLEAALVIHLHASPDSLPAELLLNSRREHAALFGTSARLRSRTPSVDSIRRWAESNRRHVEALHSYWQRLADRI